MKWAVKQRLNFITTTLHTAARINRADLQREFGISVQQASNDLSMWQAAHPDGVVYSKTAKVYLATQKLPPPPIDPDARLMVLVPLVRLAIDRLHPTHDSGLIERLKRCIST